MNKGYIVPIILIVLLLVLAGFFVITPVQTTEKVGNTSIKATTTVPVIKEEPEEPEEPEEVEEIIDIPATTTDSEVEESEGTSTSTEIF